MSKFKSEFELVSSYLENEFIPYKTNVKFLELEVFREFEIVSKIGLHRLDVLYINNKEKRYDIIEFKNRPLEIKDAYQVFKYMKAFYENFFFKKQFNNDFKVCFHLIGENTDDERLANLYLMNSKNFKVHVFYGYGKSMEVYPQNTNSFVLSWI